MNNYDDYGYPIPDVHDKNINWEEIQKGIEDGTIIDENTAKELGLCV